MKKILRIIRKLVGFYKLDNKLDNIINLFDNVNKKQNELLKAEVFNSTIKNSEWYTYKSISPGDSAVDYTFLYTLYRVLNDIKPVNILEFGLGQSSKLVHQFSSYYKLRATTVEHDSKWYNFFLNHINHEFEVNVEFLDLENVTYNKCETLTYRFNNDKLLTQKYDLIIVDGPFGSKRYSRSQIFKFIPNSLDETFCIIIDDCDRKGELETLSEVTAMLNENNIKFESRIYSGSKDHALICSQNLKFLTTL